MAINRILAELLIDEHKVEPFHGHFLQLGKQDINLLHTEYKDLCGKKGFGTYEAPNGGEASRYVTNHDFFHPFGFDQIQSLDYSAYEGSDIAHDLNIEIPERLVGEYDLILDGGTLEHVYDFPTAMASIGRMLKVGGRIIHTSPSSGNMDHGFYMFSPTLYHDYYTQNGFRLKKLLVSKRAWGKVAYYHYSPGMDLRKFNDGNINLVVIAEKTEQSTANPPLQNFYLNRWEGGEQKTPPGTRFSAFLPFLTRHYVLYQFLRKMYVTLTKRRKKRVKPVLYKAY